MLSAPTKQQLTALLPPYSLCVLRALEAAGHEAWVVGGWVRDALLGSPAHDVDVCTSALWWDAERALGAAGMDVHETGVRHGTVTAVCAGRPVEVTTYRVDGAYSDRRHPDEVRFVRDVREDLARRDFTINAMAFHPERGLLDPFGGRADLAAGLVRAVGVPEERFSEDALRVLRAVRFAARLGFEVEPRTAAALASRAAGLAHVARERVGAELAGILASGRAGRVLREHPEALCAAVPELAPLVGLDQRSPWHAYDVYEHTSRVLDGVECFSGGLAGPELRWAALLHDVAKPVTFALGEDGCGHFFGHAEEGARVAREVMGRMAIPGEVVRATCALVSLHERRPGADADARRLRRLARELERRCPGRGLPLAHELLTLMRADALAHAPGRRDACTGLDAAERLLREEARAHAAFSVRDLALGGDDVMRELGLSPGPAVGEALGRLLSAVVDDGVPNTRAALLEVLRTRRN